MKQCRYKCILNLVQIFNTNAIEAFKSRVD